MTDTRRNILFMVLIASLFGIWQNWEHYKGRPSILFPSAPEATASITKPVGPDAGVPSADIPAAPGAGAAAAAASAAPASAAQSATPAKGEMVKVRTDLVAVDINTVGAEIDRLELLAHKDTEHNDQNMVLLVQNAQNTYIAETGLYGAPDLPNQHTAFQLTPGPLQLADGQNTLQVTLTAESGGVRLIKTYTFTRGSYVIGVRHQVTNLAGAAVSPGIYLQLVRDSSKPAGTMRFYSPYYGPAVYDSTDFFQKVSFDDIEKKKDKAADRQATNGWVAMLQHYFVAAWIPPEGIPRTYRTQAIEGTNTFRAAVLMPLGSIAPQQSVSNDSRLYVGPEEARLLEATAPGLDRTRDYGWTRVLAEPVFWCLEHLHGLLGNWGWAIIVLTLCIKLAFFPLSAASYRSMARMKSVAPRLKVLQESTRMTA